MEKLSSWYFTAPSDILRINSEPVTFNFLKTQFFFVLKISRHHNHSPSFLTLLSFPPIFFLVKEVSQKSGSDNLNVMVNFSILPLRTKQMPRLCLNSILPQPPPKLRTSPFKLLSSLVLRLLT